MLDSWMGRGQKGSDGQDKVGLGSIRRPVIGLALGGGAARGFAHIGIIRTLVAHGIIPNVVVGTSIGAVVGGAYASGHLDTLEQWWADVLRHQAHAGLEDTRAAAALLDFPSHAEETFRLAAKLPAEDALRRTAALETLREQLRNTGIREALAIEVSFLRAFAA